MDAYYARDTTRMTECQRDLHTHWCAGCGTWRDNHVDPIWYEPRTFACPGYDGVCKCLYHLSRDPYVGLVQNQYCSVACATKARARGKKIYTAGRLW
jgi:hypothetical protein